MSLSEHTKMALDGFSLAAVIATLAAWLPPLAALASLVWTCIRIWETATVQRWIKQWRSNDYDAD